MPIFDLMLGFRVLTAVKLDGEAQCRTIEIKYERSGRMLTAEVHAELAVSQLLP